MPDTQVQSKSYDNTPSALRYSREVMLSLHDSPLVSKPENMPPLSSWFGEEAGSPAVSKSILNNSLVTRSTDKSIILGPPKTNFASSLYGGLKRTTDTNGSTSSITSKLTSSPSRIRQSEDSVRSHNNNSSNNKNISSSNNTSSRMPRGPAFVGDKGFHHHHHHNHHHHHHHHNNSNNNNNRQENSGSLERRTSNSFNQSMHSKRYSYQDHAGDRPSTGSASSSRRDYNRDQHGGGGGSGGSRLHQMNHNDTHNDRNQERVPEWMDYNPDTGTTTADNDDKKEHHTEFANDLEAWKSSMKKKEGLSTVTEKQKQALPSSVPEAIPSEVQSKEKPVNDRVDKIMDLGSLELNAGPSSPLNMSSFFDTAASPTSEQPIKRGSRFAKFFAKREETAQIPPSSASSSSTAPSPLNSGSAIPTAQPRKISVNDLFQSPANVTDVSNQLPTPISKSDLLSVDRGASSRNQDAAPNVRMLSEDDVLQSLGAKKAGNSPEQSSHASNPNAIGFNKVLQILSQPKPSVPVSSADANPVTSSGSLSNSKNQFQEKQLEANGTSNEAAIATAIASATQSPKVVKQHGSSPSVTETVSPPSSATYSKHTTPSKPKSVNSLFGGNLPTSVLRQMSVRSEGRSPSLSSNKSGHSGRFSHSTNDSQNGSPLAANASPSSIHMAPSQSYHQQPQSYHQQQQQPPLLPMQQQQQQQQQMHSPSNYPYNGYSFRTPATPMTSMSSSTTLPHRNGVSSEGPSRTPVMNDLVMMNPHAARNQQPNGYDIMAHPMYASSDNGMRPLPPNLQQQGLPGMNGHRMMNPQFIQQQQAQQALPSQQQPPQMSASLDRSFVPPPHPHPPMVGLPSGHPMMSPHLPMRLPAQVGNGNVVPPPFIQPHMPGMPPPPIGIPQQMYANKNPGWNPQ